MGFFGWRQGALFLVGLSAGVILFHAAFGFTSAWREVVNTGRGAGLRAQMMMLALTVLIFARAASAFAPEQDAAPSLVDTVLAKLNLRSPIEQYVGDKYPGMANHLSLSELQKAKRMAVLSNSVYKKKDDPLHVKNIGVWTFDDRVEKDNARGGGPPTREYLPHCPLRLTYILVQQLRAFD